MTDELERALYEAERRVLKIRTELHRWARDGPHRRFDDLFDPVADPGFLLVARDRVRSNKGARTAGVGPPPQGHGIGTEIYAGHSSCPVRGVVDDTGYQKLTAHVADARAAWALPLSLAEHRPLLRAVLPDSDGVLRARW